MNIFHCVLSPAILTLEVAIIMSREAKYVLHGIYTTKTLIFIFIFFAITFTSASMESGYYFLLPYLEGVGIEIGTLGGLVMGLCYAVSFTLRPFVPYASKRLGRQAIIRFGYVCYIISALGLALFARSALSAVLWRTLAGLGMGVVSIIVQSYEYQLLPEAVRGRCVSLITIAYSLPSLLVVPTMEMLLKQQLYSFYIFTFPLIAALGLFAVMKLPEADDISIKRNIENVSYISLLKSPQIIFFAMSVALFAFSDAGQLRFVQLAEERGITASYFFSVSALIAMLFRLFCGKLVDKLPRKVCAPISTLIVASMIFVMTFATGRLCFIVCGIIFGLAMGFGYPVFMCLTLDLGGRRSAVLTLAVIFGFTYNTQFFLAPIALQYILNITGDATTAFRLLYGIIMLLSIIVIYFSPRMYKES